MMHVAYMYAVHVSRRPTRSL